MGAFSIHPTQGLMALTLFYMPLNEALQEIMGNFTYCPIGELNAEAKVD